MSTDRVEPAVNEIILTRSYEAPRALVFEAWTKQAHLDRWWGPNGYVTVTDAMAFEVGGEWRFTMTHAAHGIYPNRIRYLEISPPERLLYDHDSGVDDDPDVFRVEVRFEERDGCTEVTMQSRFRDADRRAAVERFGAVELGKQTLARLADLLERGLAAPVHGTSSP